jgi:hypothetical protein
VAIIESLGVLLFQLPGIVPPPVYRLLENVETTSNPDRGTPQRLFRFGKEVSN